MYQTSQLIEEIEHLFKNYIIYLRSISTIMKLIDIGTRNPQRIKSSSVVTIPKVWVENVTMKDLESCEFFDIIHVLIIEIKKRAQIEA